MWLLVFSLLVSANSMFMLVDSSYIYIVGWFLEFLDMVVIIHIGRLPAGYKAQIQPGYKAQIERYKAWYKGPMYKGPTYEPLYKPYISPI